MQRTLTITFLDMLYSLGGNTNYMRVFSQRDWNFFLYLLFEVIAIKKYCSSSFRGVWRGVALLHTNSWKLVKAHHDFRRFKFFIRARIAESRVEKFPSPIRLENPSIRGWSKFFQFQMKRCWMETFEFLQPEMENTFINWTNSQRFLIEKIFDSRAFQLEFIIR